MEKYKIALSAGDGIGAELIRQVKKRFTAEALPKDGRIVTTDELGDAVANEI